MSLPLRKNSKRSDAATENVFDLATAKPLPHTTAGSAPGMLTKKDLIVLYQSIEGMLPGMQSRIVQLISCGRGEGVTTITADLASLATSSGCRTLFIDICPASSEVAGARKHALAPLTDVTAGHASLANAIALSTEKTSFDYACLASDPAIDRLLGNRDAIRQILTRLRSQYPLILLHASNVLNDPAGIGLCDLADGVVIVVEAEHTRMPAARQALKLLSGKGAKIIGLAFNKRRYYVPRWLYRWL